MLMLALRLILKGKGGKQHSLPFIGCNLGVEIFLKKREHQNRMRWNRGLKGILKALFSCIPWLLNFSDLPNYGSKLRKIYTLRLLSKCLGKSTPPPPLAPIRGKVPSQPFDSLFDSLRCAPVSLALHLCSGQVITKWCKVYTKTGSWFQNSYEDVG